MMNFSLVKNAFVDGWNWTKENFVDVLIGFAKIEFLSGAALLASIAVGLIIMLLSGSLGNVASLAGLVVAVAVILVGAIIFLAIGSTRYNFIWAMINKKKFDIKELSKTNTVPIIKYTILGALISLVVIVPAYVAFFFVLNSAKASGNTNSVTAIGMIFQFVMWTLSALITVFTQFAIFEITINKTGIIKSFVQSFEMAKKNFLETLSFTVVTMAISLVLVVPFIIIASAILGIGIASGGLAAILGVITMLWAIVVVIGVLLHTLTLAPQYNFWMEIRPKK